MDDRSGEDKEKRRYDASRRRARAARRRETVLDEAERLFMAKGYAATTVASIAEAAGVSVETIYKAGGKAGLVRAIYERRLEGPGPVPVAQEYEPIRQRETDPYRLVDAWGRGVTAVMPLVSPILLLVREAAATDPEIAALRDEIEADRLRRRAADARDLVERSVLREDVTLDEATDVLWTYSAAELYELLVLRRGWSAERYGRFVAEAIKAALLPAR